MVGGRKSRSKPFGLRLGIGCLDQQAGCWLGIDREATRGRALPVAHSPSHPDLTSASFCAHFLTPSDRGKGLIRPLPQNFTAIFIIISLRMYTMHG